MGYTQVTATATTLPCLVALPATPVQGMVVCCNGNGETGDGSWDGTLTESATNQLAKVFAAGPLKLVQAGVKWFSDRGIVVVHPQSPAAVWDTTKLWATIQALAAAYKVPAKKTVLTGLSSGGAAVWKVGQLHAAWFWRLAPVSGATYPGGPLPTQFAGVPVWAFHNADDGTVPLAWDVGVPTTPGVPWPLDWLGEISGVPPLDTHPDHPGALAHSGAPKVTGITHDYTGSFDPATGWTWVKGQALPTGSLAITLWATGGHDAWDRAYGTDAASFDAAFWDWLIGSAVTVYAPPADPAKLAAAAAALGRARAALDTANDAVRAAAGSQGAAVAAVQAAASAQTAAQGVLASAVASLSIAEDGAAATGAVLVAKDAAVAAALDALKAALDERDTAELVACAAGTAAAQAGARVQGAAAEQAQRAADLTAAIAAEQAAAMVVVPLAVARNAALAALDGAVGQLLAVVGG